jgi:hypothetical protein
MGGALLNTERLVQKISEAIENPGSRNDLESLAKQYKRQCQAANERLRKCEAMLSGGDLTQARRLSESSPNLFAVVALLDFCRQARWRQLCSKSSFAQAPPLDVAAFDALKQSCMQDAHAEDQLSERRSSVDIQKEENQAAVATEANEDIQFALCDYLESSEAGTFVPVEFLGAGDPNVTSIEWFDAEGELLGEGRRIELQVRLGTNRWRCVVSSSRRKGERELEIEGHLPRNVTTKTASWTPIERRLFAEKLNELSTKNPGIYETSLSTGVLDMEPLDRVWLETRVKQETLTKEQLNACFKAFFYCGEQSKQLIVKEVLDEFDALVEGESSTIGSKLKRVWSRVSGASHRARPVLPGRQE